MLDVNQFVTGSSRDDKGTEDGDMERGTFWRGGQPDRRSHHRLRNLTSGKKHTYFREFTETEKQF